MAKRSVKSVKSTDKTTVVKKPATPGAKPAAGAAKAAKSRTPQVPKAAEFVPPTAEEIAVRAYFRAMERGFSPGNAMEDWLAAEAELVAWRKAATSGAKQDRKGASRKKVERATGIEPV